MAKIRIFKYIKYRRKSFFDYACVCFQNNNFLKKINKQNCISKIKACKKAFGEILFCEIKTESIIALNEALVANGYSDNYIKGIIGTLRVAINEAINVGLLRENPIVNITLKRGIKSEEIRGVCRRSVRLIEQAKYKHPSLRFVAKLFSFQCRTGLSYIDLISLKYDEICQENGRHWLIGERCKTGRNYITPLDSVCLKIINEFRKPYKTSFKKHCNDDIFPFIKRGTYNSYLKKIGKIAGIKEAKTLSSHKARHTFAECMLEKGVSVESIRKMLGHSPSSQATWLYAKVTLKKLNDEIKKKC